MRTTRRHEDLAAFLTEVERSLQVCRPSIHIRFSCCGSRALKRRRPFAREEAFVNTRLTASFRSLLLIAGSFAIATAALVAQAPAGGGQPAKPASRGPAAAPADAPATVLQVMRGILYPSSNVVFSAQADDPAAVKKASDPSTATDPLASTYGGWERWRTAPSR